MMLIFPTWIAPLFNKFTPLADEALRTRIEALMQRVGFASSGLFVMDGSKRSAHGNAYFSGFGKTKRIVFFDTLIERLTPQEVEAVLAHELGHFKLKHIVKRMVVMFAVSLGFLALLGYLKQQIWFYTGLSVDPISFAGSNLLQTGTNSVEYTINTWNPTGGIDSDEDYNWWYTTMKKNTLTNILDATYTSIFEQTYKNTIKKLQDSLELERFAREQYLMKKENV